MRHHRSAVLTKQELHLAELTLDEVATLMLQDAARYFLLAAANLNRTQLKKATHDPRRKSSRRSCDKTHDWRRLPERINSTETAATCRRPWKWHGAHARAGHLH